jgi:hypothetical protein
MWFQLAKGELLKTDPFLTIKESSGAELRLKGLVLLSPYVFVI